MQSWRSRTMNFNLLVGLILAAVAVADLVLARMVHLSSSSQRLLPGLLALVPGVLVLVVVNLYCRRRFRYTRAEGYSRLGEVSALAIWALVALTLLTAITMIAARTAAPLLDANFAQIDGVMHVSVAAIVRHVAHFPVLRKALVFSYNLLNLFALAALILPAMGGRPKHSRRYLLSVIVAVLITCAIFSVAPAIGPWVVYGFEPARTQTAAQVCLLELKSHQGVVNCKDCGIVCFPSFHVALAVLATMALWHFRKGRPVLVVLCTAIWVSTVTTGWHYVIDVFGGLAVAAAAHAIALRLVASSHAEAPKILIPTAIPVADFE